MDVYALKQIGFIPATKKSLDYLKPLAGFNNELQLNIEWDAIKTGVLAHKDNARLLLVFTDDPDKEFILGFVSTKGMRNIIRIKLISVRTMDVDFLLHIISEYVKKHINDTLE